MLYIVRYSKDINDNLKVKFEGQINGFQKLGFTVWKVYAEHKTIFLDNGQSKIKIKKSIFLNSNLYYHTFFYLLLYRSIISFIDNTDIKFDFAYVRLMPEDFFWNKMLKTFRKKKIKVVVENPTYLINDNENPKLFIQILNSILKCFQLFIGHAKVDLFTLIGDRTSGVFRNSKAINISNAVDVTSYSLRQPQLDSGKINVIAVASMCYWHGYDRLITAMVELTDKPQIHFHLVGDDGDGSLLKWKEMVKNNDLSDYFSFYGRKFGKELDDLFNMCDVAVASLALYRTNCYYASELKLREYIARGIPFIHTANDPSLDNNIIGKYSLVLENNSSKIDIDNIIAFSMKLKKDQIHPMILRRYASEKLGWDVQLEKVVPILFND